MRLNTLALSLILGACAGEPHGATPPAAEASKPAVHAGLQIKLATVYVDDQDKALRFYTEVLGFAKKDDVSNGGFRWLTVTSAHDPDGTQLQLALDNNPAAKAYHQAIFAQGQPAVMFFTDDVKREAERIKARGGELAMPPTDATMSIIATVKDTCGNLVQLTQLMR